MHSSIMINRIFTIVRIRSSSNIEIMHRRKYTTAHRSNATHVTGIQIRSGRRDPYYINIEAFKSGVKVKTAVHEEFAKVGVKEFLRRLEGLLMERNDSETLRPDEIPPELDQICGLFYRLSSVNKLCENQIVETCGLERIVNLAMMIVENPQPLKEIKSINLLCNALNNLNIVVNNKPVNDRLIILLRPVIAKLLPRILILQPRTKQGGIIGRAVDHLSSVVDDATLTDENKIKLGRLLWQEFKAIDAKGLDSDAIFALFRVGTSFVQFDIKELKGSFEWVDDFLEIWIDYMNYDTMKIGRMKAVMYFNFLIIGLKNCKYEVVYEQRDRWGKVLIDTKSFLTNREIENLKELVEQIPPTRQKLKDQLNLLLKIDNC